MMSVDLSIIVPCYNEVENIPKLQAEFLPVIDTLIGLEIPFPITIQTIEVIFVDDGSADGTGTALQAAVGNLHTPNVSFRVVQHKVNRGLGAAIRTGFATARGQVLVTTDCDGTYRFSEIPLLLDFLTEEIDMVTASPYHPQGDIDGVPGYRLLLSRGASVIYRFLSDHHIHTYTALFRAYRREVVKTVPFESSGFLAGTELLVNAIRMGYRVAEYPTVLYTRDFGESKAKLAQTMRAHLGFQAHSLTSWYPYGTLIRGRAKTVYLVENGQKRPFTSPEAFLSHGYHWEQVVRYKDAVVQTIPTGVPMGFRDGACLQSLSGNVYVVEKGKIRPFVSAVVFEQLGFNWENVLPIDSATLNQLKSGPAMTQTDRYPQGTLLKSDTSLTVYRLEDGQKRPFLSQQTFLSWNYRWNQIITIVAEELSAFPTGQPIAAQEPFNFQFDEEVTVQVLPQGA
ncbi:MAG: glycosyltransferase family 2 protein [Chloroflexi bacterium]|nr:glycosyltransferase family 2 protein [Chloroflexota bacterium]